MTWKVGDRIYFERGVGLPGGGGPWFVINVVACQSRPTMDNCPTFSKGGCTGEEVHVFDTKKFNKLGLRFCGLYSRRKENR